MGGGAGRKRREERGCHYSDRVSGLDSKFSQTHRLVGLTVEASASRAAGRGSIPACAVDLVPGHTSDFIIGASVAACQALDVIGSALGLVDPVSVYCDWVTQES